MSLENVFFSVPRHFIAEQITAENLVAFRPPPEFPPSLVYADGSLYFGDVDPINRAPHGLGIILFKQINIATSSLKSQAIEQRSLTSFFREGDRYGGHWEDGLFSGDGVLISSMCTYNGPWKLGNPHGKGVMHYSRRYVEPKPMAAMDHTSGSGVVAVFSDAFWRGLSHLSPFDEATEKPKEYTGEFHRDFNRHGEGTMLYYNGDIYEGTWNENVRSGFGKLRCSSGEEFEGHWLDDERHGRGLVRYVDGSTFKGVFEHNKRQGPGILRFSNGDEYAGSFIDNSMTGEGVMRYRNGDVYEGMWKEGRRHGEGKYTLKKNGATMKGTFIHGLIHGKGTVSLPDVSLFSGTFSRGLRSTGSMFWLGGADEEYRNNLCYQGDWKGEQLHGKGLLWFRNGGFYCGSFQDNKRHGKGNMRYPNGEEYSGEFMANIPHGWGVLQTATSTIIKAGLWQYGKLIEGYVGGWNGKQLHGLGHLSVAVHRLLSSSVRVHGESGTEAIGSSGSPHLQKNKKVQKLLLRSATVDGDGGEGTAGGGVGGVGHRFGCVVEFKGIFRNGKRHGPGLLRLPEVKSESVWRKLASSSKQKNLKNAREKENQIGQHIIKGIWKANQLDCERGVWAFPSGEVYVGGFSRNCREDPFGKLWLPNGSVFVGKWTRDAPNGEGTYFSNHPTELMPDANPQRPVVSPFISSSHPVKDGSALVDSGQAGGKPSLNTPMTTIGEDGKTSGRFLFGLWGKLGSPKIVRYDQQRVKPNFQKKTTIPFEHHHTLLATWEQQYWGISRCERVVAPSVVGNTIRTTNRHDDCERNLNSSAVAGSRSSSLVSSSISSRSSASVDELGRNLEGGTLMSSLSFCTHASKAGEIANVALSTASESAADRERNHGTSRGLSSRKAARAGPSLWEDGPHSTQVVSFFSPAESVYLSRFMVCPPEISVGKVEGDGLLIFPSGIMMLHVFADNCPQLAIPYRPLSPLDRYLKHLQDESKRFRRLQEWKGHEELLLATLSYSPSTASRNTKGRLTDPSLTVPLPPSQCSSCTTRLGKMELPNGFPTWGNWHPFAIPVTKDKKSFGPPICCSFCRSEYSFFKPSLECSFCFRSSCSSCLRGLDPSHINSPYLAHTISSSAAIMSAMFPEKQKKMAAPHAAPSFKDVLVCADCAEIVSLSVCFAIVWVPLDMFSSILKDPVGASHSFRSQKSIATPSSSFPLIASGENTIPSANAETDGVLQRAESISGEAALSSSSWSVSVPPSSSDALVPLESTMEKKVKTPPVTVNSTLPESLPLSLNASMSTPVVSGPSISEPSPKASGRNCGTPPLGIPRLMQLQDGARYATYAGYVAGGVPHLYGEMWWGTDSYYVGGFSRGRRNGVGYQVLLNGEVYAGMFCNDAWNGYGSYFFTDGSVLEGIFKDGEIDCPLYWGEQKSSTSSVSISSSTSSLCYDGLGIQFDLRSGSIYNGEWKNGEKNGQGFLFHLDGSHFTGRFINDRIDGPGILVRDSSTFFGHFKNGQKDGSGVEFFIDCAVEGMWKANAGEGLFRIFDASSGDVYETSYQHGNERDDCYVPPKMKANEEVTACQQCGKEFYLFLRQHHCRLCGDVFCDGCTRSRATLPDHFSCPVGIPQRVCDICFQRLQQRRSISIRHYGSGEVYAGMWSKGKWVSRGLYTHPNGLFVVMDDFGHPIHKVLHRAPRGVSPDICLDAAPSLSAFRSIHESSPFLSLKEFIQWWKATEIVCGLHVPLEIPLVDRFQQHMMTLLQRKEGPPVGAFTAPEVPSEMSVQVDAKLLHQQSAEIDTVAKENSFESTLLSERQHTRFSYPVFPAVTKPPQFSPLVASSSHSTCTSFHSSKKKHNFQWIRSLQAASKNVPLPLSVKSYLSHMKQCPSYHSSEPSETTLTRELLTFRPKLADFDISDEEMDQKINAWMENSHDFHSPPTISSSSSSATPSNSLFPSTPPVPEYGSDVRVPWDEWDVVPLPFLHLGDHPHTSSEGVGGDSLSHHSPEKQRESAIAKGVTENEREEAVVEEVLSNVMQHYTACPFWRSKVIDMQEVIERGKVQKAQELMMTQISSVGNGPPLFPVGAVPASSMTAVEKSNASSPLCHRKSGELEWLPGVMSGPLDAIRVLTLLRASEQSIIPYERVKRKGSGSDRTKEDR